MLVVKLGGSLLGLPELERLLIEIKQQQLPIILLPGGGKFADIVRQEQKQHSFSDKAAHKMAILAMQQVAELLSEMSGLPFYSSANKLSSPEIFPPDKLLTYEWDIPEDWTVTSDSLAILLAKELRANKCVLVKACEFIEQANNIQSLSHLGVVDEYAPIAAKQYHGEIQVVSIRAFESLF